MYIQCKSANKSKQNEDQILVFKSLLVFVFLIIFLLVFGLFLITYLLV